MELTQEYFDSVVKNLATKDDIKPLATKSDVTDAVDELARVVGEGFLAERQYLEERLDVRERVQQIETDLRRIKTALHIS